MEIKIKYFTDIEPIRFIAGKSDWYDLRAAEDVEMKAGEYRLIKLGVGMQLPKGYEAHIAPRSGTFKNYGIIQANSVAENIVNSANSLVIVCMCTNDADTVIYQFINNTVIQHI